jgi:site-specific recombinase XerD
MLRTFLHAVYYDPQTRGTGIPESKRHFHVLKHSIATHLLDASADLRFVQDWIGHASIRNTVVYAQLTSRRRDEEARKVFASQYVV